MRRPALAWVLSGAVLMLLLSGGAPPASAAAKAPSPKEVARSQQRANEAAARLARAQSDLARAERGLTDLETRTAAAGTRLASLEDQVRALAVDRYVRGEDGPAWIVRGDVTDAARRRSLLRYVSLVQSDAAEAYRVARVDFDADRAVLDRRLARQRATVAGVRAEQTRIARELNRLVTAQRAYDAQGAADRKRAASSKGPKIGVGLNIGGILGRGPWICPVQGAHAFSNDWGQPRSGGRRHQGNDILAPRGTPVVASVAGSVKPNSSGLGGIAYYLKGDDGTTYYGAHLDRLSAGAGRVAAGAVIGTVGTSGNASGGPPHLHFEVHPGGGRAVNPFSVLSRFC